MSKGYIAFESDESELKHCPFCGATNANLYFVTIDHPGKVGLGTLGIECDECRQTVTLECNRMMGDTRDTRAKAIEAWNRRRV